MKRVFALLLIIGSAAFTQVQAQDKSKDIAKRVTDTMTVRLNLTADQIPKVQAINEAFTGKAADVKNSGGGKLGKFKKLKSAGKDRKEALKEVLTDEQYKQFQEQQQENREEAKERYKEKKG
jgi:Spy/CpxP family protein refolding chaperone